MKMDFLHQFMGVYINTQDVEVFVMFDLYNQWRHIA